MHNRAADRKQTFMPARPMEIRLLNGEGALPNRMWPCGTEPRAQMRHQHFLLVSCPGVGDVAPCTLLNKYSHNARRHTNGQVASALNRPSESHRCQMSVHRCAGTHPRASTGSGKRPLSWRTHLLDRRPPRSASSPHTPRRSLYLHAVCTHTV